MPQDETAQDQKTITHYKYVNAPDFRYIYSNNAHFYSHLFDFSIIFGEVTEVEQVSENVGNVTVEDRVRVVMTPLQAKVFLAVAQRQLQAYEQRFGELKFPAGIVQISSSESSEGPKET